MRCQGDDHRTRPPGPGFFGPDHPRRLETVQHGHGSVHQHHVETLGPQTFDRLLPVVGGKGLDPQPRQGLGRHLAVDLGIIDHQHANARERGPRRYTGLVVRQPGLNAVVHLADHLAQVRLAQRFDHHTGLRRRRDHSLGQGFVVTDDQSRARHGLTRRDDRRTLGLVGRDDAPGGQIHLDGPPCLGRQPANADRPAGLDRQPFGCLRRRFQRGGEGESRAFADRAGQGPFAAHRSHQPVADRQAQPGAAMRPGRALVRLREGLEQGRQLVRWNAGPGVVDRHSHPRRVGRIAVDGDQHAPDVRELDGVVDQVADHLPQPRRVGHDEGQARIDEHRQIQPLAGRLFREQAGDILGRVGQIDLDGLQIHLPGLDLGEVQDVVDDAEQGLSRL